MKKTIRINKTKENFEIIYKQLDNASGELYRAIDNLARMVDLPKEIIEKFERIDVSLIDSLRYDIRKLIEEINHKEVD